MKQQLVQALFKLIYNLNSRLIFEVLIALSDLFVRELVLSHAQYPEHRAPVLHIRINAMAGLKEMMPHKPDHMKPI